MNFRKFINIFKKKPFPFFFTNILLSIYYHSKIDLGARIYFPFNLKLGKSVLIDRCVIYAEGSGIYIDSNVSIGYGSYLNSLKGSISVKSNTSIGPYVIIYGQFKVVIGENCLIASQSSLIASNHITKSLDIPINKQGTYGNGITINNNVWIGSNATILDGVSIGAGSIIGAKSLVNKDFEDNSILCGIPAKVIKKR